MIAYEDFAKVDVRVGRVVAVDDFPRARKPAYRVTVDLGELGSKHSSVQATNYPKAELVGLDVVCVVNLPSKNIGGFLSELLILGVAGEDGQLSLLSPTRKAVPGGRVY